MKFSCPFAEKMENKSHKGVGLLHVLLWMGALTKCGGFPAVGRDALLNVCTAIRDVMIWINSERAIRSRSVSFMNAFFSFFSFFGICSINWSSGARDTRVSFSNIVFCNCRWMEWQMKRMAKPLLNTLIIGKCAAGAKLPYSTQLLLLGVWVGVGDERAYDNMFC